MKFWIVFLFFAFSCVPTPERSGHGDSWQPNQIDHERWDVKTLSDGFRIGLSVRTTVDSQCRMNRPSEGWTETLARQPDEKILYSLWCTIDSAVLEKDGDYHIIVTGGDSTMIVEIPNPDDCPSTSATYRDMFKTARSIVDRYFGGVRSHHVGSKYSKHSPIDVEIEGMGFWDNKHGRPAKGHAGNYREIHPVLKIEILTK